eukprot:scaffold340_cov177-Ochromonas_danica.AAC.2
MATVCVESHGMEWFAWNSVEYCVSTTKTLLSPIQYYEFSSYKSHLLFDCDQWDGDMTSFGQVIVGPPGAGRLVANLTLLPLLLRCAGDGGGGGGGGGGAVASLCSNTHLHYDMCTGGNGSIDLLKYYGELPFTLDFFTELPDLMPLVRYVGRHIPTASELEEEEERERQNSQSNTEPEEEVLLSPLERKFAKMTEAICEVVTDFNLVSFLPMNIEDVQTVARVVAHIDRANGFSIAEQYDELESLRVGNRTATDGTSSSRQQTTQPVGSSTSESEKSAKTLFKYASDHVTMESIYDVSFDIQNAQVIEHQHPS